MKAYLKNNQIHLKFKYDPVVLKFIRTLDGRRFDPRSKTWLLPLSVGEHNVTNLEKLGFEVDPAINDAIKRDYSVVESLRLLEGRLDSEIACRLPLYPFQRAIASYMLTAGNCLNASETGSGKTITTLAVCDELRAKRILVVCPKSVLHQWAKEIEKFLPTYKIFIAEGNKKTRTKIYQSLKDPYFLIVGYDICRVDVELLKTVAPFNIIVADEAHRIGSTPTTKTRRALKQLTSERRFALTATPLRSNLVNYYTILDWLMPGMLGSYKSFLEKYTLRNQWGGIYKYVNIEEFSRRIKRYMIRKTLDEVGYQLPALIEENIEFKLSDKEQKLYDQIKMEVLLDIEKLNISKIDNPLALNMAIVKLGKLQELSDSMELLGEDKTSTKLEILKEHLADTLVDGQKAVIFSRFERMVTILQRELGEYNPAVITGQVKERQAQVDRFNNDDNCKVMLITSAGGEGLNLNKANLLYFYDVPLGSYGALIQTIGRIKRIGQNRPMVVYYLLANGIDITLKNKLVKKGELSDRIFESVQDIKDILT